MADNQIPLYYTGPMSVPFEETPQEAAPSFYTGPIAPPSPREQEVSGAAVTGPEAFSRGFDEGLTFNRGAEYKALAKASGMPTEPSMMGNPEPLAALVGGVKVGAQKLLPNVFGTEALKKYQAEFPVQQERYKQTKEEYPKTTFAGNLGGSLVNPVVIMAGPEVKGGQILYSGLKGAGVGAGLGALYGSGEGETLEENIKNAGWGALSGGVLGAPLGMAASKFASSVPTGPTSQALREAAGNLGIPISVAATTDSAAVRGTTNLLKDIPVVGTPITESSQKTIDALAQKADELSKGVGRQEAGLQIEKGFDFWREAAQQANSKAYKSVDALVDPTITQTLDNTSLIAQKIIDARKAGRLNDPTGAVKEVLDAITDPNGLTYEGIKTARTNIGQLMNSTNLPANVSQTELKRLYGSLTEDLKASVLKAGGKDALKTFNEADTQYQKFMTDNEQVMKFLGIKPDSRSSEQVFTALLSAAKDGGKADVANLLRAKDMLPPQAWEKLGQGAVSKIGLNNKGDFDANNFIRNWNSFSDAGKDALFGQAGSGTMRDSLDAISTVSKNMDRLSLLATPPDAAAKGSLALATILNPLATMVAVSSGRVVSSMLARPASAKAVGAFAKAYEAYVRSGASEAASKLLQQSVKNLAVVSGGDIEPEQLLKATVGSYMLANKVYNFVGGQQINDVSERVFETGQASGGRVERKSGGRVANAISTEVDRTRALLSNKTASMLSMPDDAIITALNHAKNT